MAELAPQSKVPAICKCGLRWRHTDMQPHTPGECHGERGITNLAPSPYSTGAREPMRGGVQSTREPSPLTISIRKSCGDGDRATRTRKEGRIGWDQVWGRAEMLPSG